MTNHTPGPWELGYYCCQPTIFDSRGNGTVAIATVHDGPIEGSQANAELIARAPEMAERIAALESTNARLEQERIYYIAEAETERATNARLRELLREACKSIECYDALHTPESEWDEYDYMMFPIWKRINNELLKAE